MSETESESADGGVSKAGMPPAPTSPPAFAKQVATLIGDDVPYRTGELPLWSRLDSSSAAGPGRTRLLATLAWCVAIGLLCSAVLRIVAHDAVEPLAWFNAFTLYLYLPAYFLLAYAAWTRRWWLATASAAAIACHLTWVLPDFRAATPYANPSGAAATPSRTLRVLYANVRGGRNVDVDRVLAELRSYDPDVIIVAEMHREWVRQLYERRPLIDYPFGTDMDHRNTGDLGVFSRVPIARMEQILIQHRATQVIDIRLGEKTLRLFAVHSPRPNRDSADDYYTFWRTLEPIIADAPRPAAVIGDFNATQHSQVVEQLEADGFRSAHEDRGRGYAVTWPNGANWLPPIRIDQAFVSPDLECISIREGLGAGSDHKPLVLDLRVY
jgi:endonuclease/exonuclease/phosphatase (EEP) superfamily protein YafD